jgi:undecaprenyl-diphosphatase
MNRLFNIDGNMFHLINGAWANPVFNVIMPIISEIGSGEVLFAVSLILFVVRRKKAGGRLALLLLAGLTITYYIVYFLKISTARPRPFSVFTDANIIAAEKSFSFPSGHAAQSFMAATVLSGTFPKWRGVLLTAAALVAYSRIYLGAHFLTDVLGGAVIGMIVGYGLLNISRSACNNG